jgi:hypothetical protein
MGGEDGGGEIEYEINSFLEKIYMTDGKRQTKKDRQQKTDKIVAPGFFSLIFCAANPYHDLLSFIYDANYQGKINQNSFLGPSRQVVGVTGTSCLG